MTNKDLEKYIKVIAVDPKSKYLLVISDQSGVSRSDAAKLKLDENFLDEIIMVHGNINEVIQSIPITKEPK